jgi:NAD-reducing hydrogenase small subunit
MAKPRIATVSLCGCFGCHMSLLDIDERILELVERVDFDRSPVNDLKEFTGTVDVGLIEGGCCNEENVRVLREFRKHCRVLVAVGDCAIHGGVPALRNMVSLAECLRRLTSPARASTIRGAAIPDDIELPLLLDRVSPIHEVVKIDACLPGCPPSADTLWAALNALLAGEAPVLPYELLKYD